MRYKHHNHSRDHRRQRKRGLELYPYTFEVQLCFENTLPLISTGTVLDSQKDIKDHVF